jgi:hypothetical protein
MRPVAGRGLKIEGHIRLRINDLGGGRYLDTPSDRSFDASHDPHLVCRKPAAIHLSHVVTVGCLCVP